MAGPSDQRPAPRTAHDAEIRLRVALAVIAEMTDQPRAAAFAGRELDSVQPFFDARLRRDERRAERKIDAAEGRLT